MLKDIIEVYEEHFAIGYERGLSDSEIIKSLGTPEEIYASYVDAGIITETLTQDGSKSKSVNMELSTLDLKITKSACYLSYQAWQKSIQTLLSIGSALSYM